ncbi:MAG: ECF transporter S component [Clostridia bacterium]|nr:ECF transporter S component [Clostridia bacterium]
MATSRFVVKHKAAWALLLLPALTVLLWLALFPDQYFLVAVLLVVEVLALWLLYLEFEKPSPRELALMAALATLGVAGRALFFFVPQVKPTAAIVLISGLALGKAPGFTIGLLTMFLSNFLFGQSISTPFQMLGMGLVGFAAGFFAKRERPLSLPLVAGLGFGLTFLLYGLLVDSGSALFLYRWQGNIGVWSVYLAGIPFNFVHALSTAAFLFFLSPLLTRQLTRICRKYGLFRSRMLE